MKHEASDYADWTPTPRGFVHVDGGLWRSRLGVGAKPLGGGRAALLLDRDGVVVEEVNYLGRPQDARVIAKAAQAIAAANCAGVPVIVVTNQSGVARGYFGWPDFESVHEEIDRQLAAFDARIDAIYACGYHEKGSGALALADHPWRKPHPGMAEAAAADYELDLTRCALVGDKAADLASAKAAGLRRGALVSSGYGADADEIAAARALQADDFSTVEVADALEAWTLWRAQGAFCEAGRGHAGERA